MTFVRTFAPAACAALVSGCAVGYVTVRVPHDPDAGGPPADWTTLHVAVSGSPSQRFAATRVLRTRHGVLDVPTAPGPAEAFTLAIRSGAVSNPGLPFAILSFVTFAAVPGYIEDRRHLELELTAPDGATFTARTSLSEATISWLPLLFLGADTFHSLNDQPTEFSNQGHLDQLAGLEEVVARFLASAERFVAGHAPPAEAP